MQNIPQVHLGLIAVSRDCFPIELSISRRQKVKKACDTKNISITELQTVIEKEADVLTALQEIKDKNINSLVIYLGNFGPEGPTSLLAAKFSGPVMVVAAAEESGDDLVAGRGDAYCGLLSLSYNIGLRNIRPFIPSFPVGTFNEVAEMVAEFVPVARILLGLRQLKIFTFGPRPQDFLACNAPIKPLYDLGVEVMENSELDLYDIYQSVNDDAQIAAVAKEMASELGSGNRYPDLLLKLARLEVALLNFMSAHLGAAKFGIFANKCWPSYEKYFGFVPCYVNSRLAARGIPVACEVDIYGALSEYIAVCATGLPATLLDINNTVPDDMIDAAKQVVHDYKRSDLFMGFHCGNTPAGCLVDKSMKYQLIMHRLMEPGKEPNITRGTLEGRLRSGPVTIFRLQSTANTELRAYMAEGEVLDIEPKSFGSIGVFAVREMARFYRHVLIEKRFPHHTAVAFAYAGRALFSTMRLLGITDVYYNLPQGVTYEGENPF